MVGLEELYAGQPELDLEKSFKHNPAVYAIWQSKARAPATCTKLTMQPFFTGHAGKWYGRPLRASEGIASSVSHALDRLRPTEHRPKLAYSNVPADRRYDYFFCAS